MRYLLLASMLMLAACSNLATLERQQPVASDFTSSLASEYLSYAQSEAELGRKASANYFAGKGLKISKGETVLPEEPSAWHNSIALKQQAKLTAERNQLMRVYNENNQRVVPQKLARAQLLFDCWVEQSSQKVPVRPKAPCAAEFQATLKELVKADNDYKKPAN